MSLQGHGQNRGDGSGGSRQNVDQVLSQKNLMKNEIFAHFHSNLENLTGFQKPCDPLWICHWMETEFQIDHLTNIQARFQSQ